MLRGHKGIIVANDSLIDNSGSISTSGANGYGVDLSGTGNIVTHSGTISTGGDSGHGIYAAAGTSASYNDITVEAGGNIITAGETAYGIYLGDYAQLILEAADATTGAAAGSITTSGAGAHGIYAEASTTITNAGDIAPPTTMPMGSISSALTTSSLIRATSRRPAWALSESLLQTVALL